MALALSFTVFGEKQLNRFFDDFALGITNFKIPFSNISKDFYATQKQVFQREGAIEGRKAWAPLSSKYAEWKGANFPSRKILELSGDLKKASTTQNAKGSVFKLTNTLLEMGVNLNVGGWNLAELHQFGTKNMPQRKVIDLTNKQKVRWTSIFSVYIQKLAEKSGKTKGFGQRTI